MRLRNLYNRGVFLLITLAFSVAGIAPLTRVYAEDNIALISGNISLSNGQDTDATICFQGNNSEYCEQADGAGNYSIHVPTVYAWGTGPVIYDVYMKGNVGSATYVTDAYWFGIGSDTQTADLNLVFHVQQQHAILVDAFNTRIANAPVALTLAGTGSSGPKNFTYSSTSLSLTPRTTSNFSSLTDTKTSDTNGEVTFLKGINQQFGIQASAPPGTFMLGGMGSIPDGSQSPTVTVLMDYPIIQNTTTTYYSTTTNSISWASVENAVLYKIYRITQSTCHPFDTVIAQCSYENAFLAQQTNTTFTDAPNMPEENYLYAVAAIDAQGRIIATNTRTNVISQYIDRTKPTVDAITWSNNPKATTGTATVYINYSDPAPPPAPSGVMKGEYFIGDNDPGLGNGTSMEFTNDSRLQAPIGSDFQPGVYKYNFRVMDYTGNWSETKSDYLVVFDPQLQLGMTGKNKKNLIPSLANGDILPGLNSSGQTDVANYGFTVNYNGTQLSGQSDFQFNYETGAKCNSAQAHNCSSFNLNATSFTWLYIDQVNNSRGRYQGIATVNVNGEASENIFTVEGLDGDRMTTSIGDAFTLKVYPAGYDPTNSQPIYKVSASLPLGNSVKIN